MGDGITFIVPGSYDSFAKRWQQAMLGSFYWRVVIRFHSWFGVRVRSKPRFIKVVHGDSNKRVFLNPKQIVYIMQGD
jgi:hypothetical protein